MPEDSEPEETSKQSQTPKKWLAKLWQSIAFWLQDQKITSKLLKEHEPASELINDLTVNVKGLNKLTVEDIMTPRNDIAAVEVNTNAKDARHLLSKNQYSAIPIYQENLDNIVGYIKINDILKNNMEISDIYKNNILLVPQTLPVTELLLKMHKQQTQIAIALDEYEGVAGLATFYDISRAICGKWSEFVKQKFDPEHDYIKLPNGKRQIHGRYLLEHLQQKFDLKLDDELLEDIDTVSGFITAHIGYMPEAGEVIKHPCGIEFTIAEANPRAIQKIIFSPQITIAEN
jgi:CBS domain containing-hemolysin-like protein